MKKLDEKTKTLNRYKRMIKTLYYNAQQEYSIKPIVCRIIAEALYSNDYIHPVQYKSNIKGMSFLDGSFTSIDYTESVCSVLNTLGIKYEVGNTNHTYMSEYIRIDFNQVRILKIKEMLNY